MKSKSPTHNVTWAQAILQKLAAEGIPEKDLVQGLGISPNQFNDPDAQWSFENTLAIFRRACALTNNDLFGFHLAQEPDLVKRAGLLAYVGVSAPTVGGYLRNITRFQRVFGDASTAELEEGPETSFLRWRYEISSTSATSQYAEFGGLGTLYTLRRYSNRTLTPRYVHFAHHRSKNTDPIVRFLGCEVLFGQRENVIALKTKDLDLPLITADDHLQRTLFSICEATIARLPRDPDSTARRVERCASEKLASGTATLEKISAELGMSQRTLARRLTEEGTTFAALMADLRKALARDYLLNSPLPLTEIAFLLGYNDASSFSTAFRRWFNTTPRQFRVNEGVGA
ncbi:AraC family transcriptional regulator [Shimia isoporae]|uniref:AraC family transcriptional regulator n=1 Tax=Shimia isoporae TaxID=647720 RepID=A0A4R1N3L0_9RHOB|nr:AraC family transcriptional regulator [Shimia isoporae]TCL01298.1 AraC family transcriptional regulator [Shimia isoporae]